MVMWTRGASSAAARDTWTRRRSSPVLATTHVDTRRRFRRRQRSRKAQGLFSEVSIHTSHSGDRSEPPKRGQRWPSIFIHSFCEFRDDMYDCEVVDCSVAPTLVAHFSLEVAHCGRVVVPRVRGAVAVLDWTRNFKSLERALQRPRVDEELLQPCW